MHSRWDAFAADLCGYLEAINDAAVALTPASTP
jgi:hypothetical protein